MGECQLILIAGDNVSEAGFVANSIEVVGAGWENALGLKRVPDSAGDP